jgi:hypothetical protein
MQFFGFFERCTSSHSEFFNGKFSASVSICGQEVLSSTDKFFFFGKFRNFFHRLRCRL